MPKWNPDLYMKFSSERTQAAIDLAARVRIESPQRILDAGCGPGNSTAILCEQWPKAELIGLDNSLEMIEAAQAAYPQGHWVCDDVATWHDDSPFDLIFSNAVLQWLPNHQTLLPRMLTQLSAGGALAVQMPAHYQSKLHHLIHEVAEVGAWRDQLKSAQRTMNVARPEQYYDILSPRCTRVDIWETIYFHVMEDAAAILNWIRSTGLRPFLEALSSEDERAEFETKVLSGIKEIYRPAADGRVLFPFPRLFLLAYK